MNFRHAAALAIAALLTQGAHTATLLPGISTTQCDPTVQSCAPGTSGGIDLGGGGGGGSCTPTPGGSPCGGAGPATQGNSSSTNQGAGNPIHLINGNKYQREVDMPALPGLLGLEVVRHYNSSYGKPHIPPGMLGRGWLLSYEARLYDHPANLQIVQADGTRIIFSRNPDSPSLCASEQPGNGIVRVVDATPLEDRHFLWRWMDGRELRFNHRGRLTRISLPSGEQVQLRYNARGTRLLQVTDPQGRSLHLRYARDGSRVQAIDSPVGRIEYRHGSAPLPESAQPADKLRASLVQVLLPAAASDIPVQRHYHYEDPRHPTLLTGISVQGQGSDGKPMNQRIASYAYGSNGRAISSVRGPPDSQQQKVTLDLSQPWKNTLTNSLGQKTTYHYDTIGGQWRLLQVRGPGCASCGPGDMRYQYDGQGRLTEATRLDTQGRPLEGTRTDLDPFGRPLAVYRIAYASGRAQAPQLQVRYGYGKDPWKQYGPELIARPSVVPGRAHQIRIRYNSSRQPLQITETGFSPLDAQGQPAGSADQATAIERSTRYRYTLLNGRSVLVDLDGPLPRMPGGYEDGSAPQNDLTQLRWDRSGSRVTRVLPPDGSTVELRYDAAGLIVQVDRLESAQPGWRTEFRHDAQTRLVALRSGSIGSGRWQEQAWRYDALGQLSETGQGGWPAKDGSAYVTLTREHRDVQGRLLWSADSRGSLIDNHFDSEGRLTKTGLYGGRAGDGSSAMALVKQYPHDVPTPPTAPGPQGDAAPQARQLYDDFGRSVATLSPDSGLSIRGYDGVDRLVHGRDAQGHQAHYEYDRAGRILQQTVTTALTSGDVAGGRRSPSYATRWRYQGARLVALEHPEQSEIYEYSAQGLRIHKRITRHGAAGQADQHHSVRYEYDGQGRNTASSLPDGSLLIYERDALGQITGLQRQRVQTPWLRWLSRAQPLASGIERDLVGLRSLHAGNGMQARYQRSREGTLARIVYRQTEGLSRPAPGSSSAWMQPARPAEIASQLPGGGLAHAADRPATASATRADSDSEPPSLLPGAMDLPQDPQALMDQRYLWDLQGNLLLRQDRAGAESAQNSYGYDLQDRLIAEVRDTGNSQQASRYHYDGKGRRVLDQQGVTQDELRSGTRAIGYQPSSHRWAAERQRGLPLRASHYNASGQPLEMDGREYRWDALGRLEEVRAQGATVARYRYNHRGERIAKQTGGDPGTVRAYLYEDGQLSAELDGKARITRQYIYLGILPIAVIDTPAGRTPAQAGSTLLRDLATIARRWLGQDGERLAWLHTNHLGAVEAATDEQGQLLWRAAYTAFGQRLPRQAQASGFDLALRLPGQYFDAETGLHYNLQRYYDPGRGQYLTPDPLGTPDGPHPYAYVRHNPLRYIDPQGLILFAFDGTGNSNPPPDRDTVSNVYKFYLAYDEDANGKKWHMNGAGRDDPESGIKTRFGDVARGVTARERVDYMLGQLDKYIETHPFSDGKKISIDIVGFSRGAATARDFANRIATRMEERRWNEKSACVELRFLGLWDTVAQFGALGASNDEWQMAIPAQMQHVFQAVALNEHRRIFPGEAIGRGTQLGFVGSHADIGGSFGTGDLSNVALNWIVEKARETGLKIKKWDVAGDEAWGKVTDPVLHDKSTTIAGGIPEDSLFCLKKNNESRGNCTSRRIAEIKGMTHTESQKFIRYRDRPIFDADGVSAITGDIDMKEYAKWLKENYGLTVALQ